MNAIEAALYALLHTDATLAIALPGAAHLVTVDDAEGGTFTLGYGGAVTAPIAHDATAATVQAALAALASVGTGNVAVIGVGGGSWAVTFTGALSGSSLPLSGDGAKLEGAGVTLAVAQRAAVYNTVAPSPPSAYLVFTKIASTPAFAYNRVAQEQYRYQFMVVSQGPSRTIINAALARVHDLLAFGELVVTGETCWGVEKVGDGPAGAEAEGGTVWQWGSADYRVLLGGV